MTSIRYPPSRQNHRKESWRRIMTNYIIIQIEIIKNSISTNLSNILGQIGKIGKIGQKVQKFQKIQKNPKK